MPSKQYYDPVKAREYYLRTRELKGRKKGSSTPPPARKKRPQRESKEDIEEREKGALDLIKKNYQAETEALRENASKRREAIKEKLSAFLEQVSEATEQKSVKISDQNKSEKEKIAAKRKADAEQISADAKRKIAQLPEMPKNLNSYSQRRWRKKRSEELAKIRGEADSAREKVFNEASQEIDKANANTGRVKEALREGSNKIKTSEKDKAKASTDKVAAELKSSLSNAREEYDKLKDAFRKKYKKQKKNAK
jgi:hypothetical protein